MRYMYEKRTTDSSGEKGYPFSPLESVVLFSYMYLIRFNMAMTEINIGYVNIIHIITLFVNIKVAIIID